MTAQEIARLREFADTRLSYFGVESEASDAIKALCDALEQARAERDAALAEVASLRAQLAERRHYDWLNDESDYAYAALGEDL